MAVFYFANFNHGNVMYNQTILTIKVTVGKKRGPCDKPINALPVLQKRCASTYAFT